jgi:MmyB-like transcription regulator ligand binding domain
MDDFSTLPPERRDLLRLLFTQPAFEHLLIDENDRAFVVARFRASMADHLGEPA